uniref:Low temperature requirement protein A n=2 Tax=Rhodosorus marinus TaxID=101924 RepID=A0A7S3A8M8_9RHOD|mmetsp:Transcript_5128/g.22154  ORF Transcript_5128/g.22154 Transcript_5128/m.22154 type:complete len:438 (+) Transcript_5128:290-1603(+)|eukprot:CAMPEP_0113963778 /NCGR_PEP_ID=MMETSP0011_2-20120614/6726_1 /TAXON_ID=101924 /ORGANISM="Rhodosorus marinus" /LENGTH=437 /DNA_ID=CAMNT_0000975913 /DNA_START=170 /DNA_END=1483 /DNA_ORIENTATION=- /assembly_acc=CAM_ASM_000156
MRTLIAKPRLLADWGEEYEERAAEWWELFLDLVFVAAASNTADSLKEDLSWSGLLAFFVLFSFFYSGWSFYTFHQTRYYGNSMYHLALLYFYILGTAGMVVNSAGFEYMNGFSVAALIQRIVLILMYLDAYIGIPRARIQCRFEIGALALSCVCLFSSIFVKNKTFSIGVWIIAAISENMFYVLHHIGFHHSHLVPLNIDHCAERMGCLLMVILGESVISGVISGHNIELKSRRLAYYGAMMLTILMAFSFGLIYYAVIPPRELHAYRRSVSHGIGFVWVHWAMLCSLLAMGTGVKFVVSSLIHDEHPSMERGQIYLLFFSLAISMLCLVALRALHFWGVQPTASDPPRIRRIKYSWWAVISVWFFIPLSLGLYFGASSTAVRPMVAMFATVPCVLGYAMVETVLTHVLDTDGFGDIKPEGLDEDNTVRVSSYHAIK